MYIADRQRIPGIITGIRSGSSPVGFDTETQGLGYLGNKVLGFSLAFGGEFEGGIYLPLQHATLFGSPHPRNLSRELAGLVVEALIASKRLLVSHNWVFDLGSLTRLRFALPDDVPLVDTLVAAWLCARGERPPGGFGLKPILRRELGLDPTELSSLGSLETADLDVAAAYASADAVNHLALWTQVFEPRLEDLGLRKIFDQVEMPIVRVLAHMRRWGIALDVGYLEQLGTELDLKLLELQGQLNSVVDGPFPTTSPQVLSLLMYEHLEWWSVDPAVCGKAGKSGRRSTDHHVLELQARYAPEARGRQVAELLLRHRELSKLRSTYTTSLVAEAESDGRVRSSFLQHGTVTGRFSSSSPNLQNIPRPGDSLPSIRRALVAERGWLLLDGDYSQLELRLMAHFSGDPVMLAVYQDPEGDIHATTARECGCSRQQAKSLNFGLIYGMSARTLAESTGMSYEDAHRYKARYYRTYAGVFAYHRKIEALLRAEGRVRTGMGRYRMIPYAGTPAEKAAAVRTGVNTVIQGTAADLVKKAMVDAYRIFHNVDMLDGSVRILVQVHDELLLEVRENIAEIARGMLKRVMEQATTLRVPLLADPHLGPNWHEAKS